MTGAIVRAAHALRAQGHTGHGHRHETDHTGRAYSHRCERSAFCPRCAECDHSQKVCCAECGVPCVG